MKKSHFKFAKSLIALVLTVALAFGAVVPAFAMPAEKVTSTATVPVTDAKLVLPVTPVRQGIISTVVSFFGKATPVIAGIGWLVKGGSSIYYAAKNGNFKDDPVGFVEDCLDYFSGNAGGDDATAEKIDLLNGKIDALNELMKTEFQSVRSEIAAISTRLDQLESTLSALAVNQTDRLIINQFKNDYLVKLKSLQNAYSGLQACLNIENASGEAIKRAFDELYKRAVAFSDVQYYLTGANDANNESIMEIYQRYKNDDEATLQFIFDIYTSDLLYRYCMNLCSVYQVGYMGLQGESSYVPVSSVTDVDAIYLENMAEKMQDQMDEQTKVSASIIRVLLNIDDTPTASCAYITEQDFVYPLELDLSKTQSVYPHSKYGMVNLLDNFPDLFIGRAKYVSSDEKLATISDTGMINVIGSSGNFTVSALYEGNLLYSVNFSIVPKQLSGGYGTEAIPYLIANKADLKAFDSDEKYWNQNLYFQLVNNIDMKGETWTSRDFNGNFDGNGYTISGLTGGTMFKSNSGTIQNLTLTEANIATGDLNAATYYIGGIAIQNYGNIVNCQFLNSKITSNNPSNSITSSGDAFYAHMGVYVGGICAVNYGQINRCTSSGNNISGRQTNGIPNGGGACNDITSYAGGIAGSSANGSSITDCLSSNNTIYQYIKSNSYYVCIWYLFTKMHYACAAYFYMGNVCGVNNGTATRCMSYQNSVTYGWEHDTCHASGNTDFWKDDGYCYPSVSTDDYALSKVSADRAIYESNGWKWGTTPTLENVYGTISVTANESKNTYYVGEEINPAGLTVTTADGAPVIGYTVSANTSKIGQTTVTVAKNGKTVTYPITVIAKICDVHQWNNGKVTNAPLCTERGLSLYTCTVCGSTKTETIPALGHSYGEWVYTNENQHAHACIRCSVTESEEHNFQNGTCTICNTACKSHQWDNGTESKAATCTKQGVMLHTCVICGSTKTETIPALGHSYGAWTYANESTHTHTCSRCNNVENDHHDFKNGTCTICKTVCDNHQWNTGNVIKPASCTEQSITQYTCKICGTTKTETSPALGHSFGAWENTNQTVHTHTCIRCNLSESQAHNYVGGTCTVCGAVDTSIPETDSKITVSGAVCTAGTKQIKVPVVISKNPGVASVRLTVNYNDQVMTLVGIEDGGILGNSAHSSNYRNGYILSWENDTATENFRQDGTIVTLIFELKDGIAEGEYPISVSYNYANSDILDVDLKKVPFQTETGYVKVIHTMIGDVDGDGIITPKDRMILARVLAHWDGYTMDDIDTVAADVDGDGQITSRDRIILSRYLAGWDGYETLPPTAA